MTLEMIRSDFAFLDDWEERGADGAAVLRFQGDSDAHIVRGLIAILFAIYSSKTVDDVLGTDGQAIFAELGLKEHVTPQRSNGFAAMLERIRSDARVMAAKRSEPVSQRLELQRL
jgi:cysteine desulfuration protein SufE